MNAVSVNKKSKMNISYKCVDAIKNAKKIKNEWDSKFEQLPELFRSNQVKVYGYYKISGPLRGLTYAKNRLKGLGCILGESTYSTIKNEITFYFQVPTQRQINDLKTFVQTTLTPDNFERVEYGETCPYLSKDSFFKGYRLTLKNPVHFVCAEKCMSDITFRLSNI